MKGMRDLSIRQRLTVLLVLTAGMALLSSFLVFLAYEHRALKDGVVRDLRTQAAVVSQAVAADLDFGTYFSGTKSLGYLASNKHVLAAQLYDADGKPFTAFQAPGHEAALPQQPSPTDAVIFRDNTVELFVRIHQEGAFKGTLFLRSDLAELDTRFWWAVKLMAGVGLGLLALVAAAASLLQRQISEPILSLADTARQITQHRDYGVRLERPHGGEVGILVDAFNDMLAQIKARDAQLLDHQEHLEDQVALRSEQLMTANTQLLLAKEKAEEASRAKSSFLANMSHELRTPLNAILLYSELLTDEVQERGMDDLTGDLAKIQNAGRHLLSLIDDILDLSKIEAGRMNVYLETVDVAALVTDVQPTVEALMAKNRNQFISHVDVAVTDIRTDIRMLRQTLYNLLNNASKFTDGGQVTLSVTLDPVPGWICFQVRDTGIGMTPEQLDRIFQEFTQADESTTRKFGGTGLGLALSRRFIAMLGGELKVASESGQGSTFTVRLPMVGPSQGQTQGTPQQLRGNPPKILVIDDDASLREGLSRVLTKAGFWVATAHGGEEGLAMARELHPQVITLDIAMPGMDGWQVIETLKGDPDLCNIPVVIITMMEDRARGLALGAAGFIRKPVDRVDLLKLLARLPGTRPEAPLLVVEDEAETARAMERMLTQAGWPVVVAEDGKRALARLVDQKPRCILLDLMLPEIDGFGVLAQLRANPDWADIPVVVVTAKDLTPEDLQELMAPPIRQIIHKGSFSRDELMESVRNITLNLVTPLS